MAWDDDTLRYEVASMFRSLGVVDWDTVCDRLVVRRREVWRSRNEGRRRICPKCKGTMHHGAEQCAACFAKTKLPYKRCAGCGGKRDHKDWSRCMACDFGDKLTMKWMKRDTLKQRLLKGLSVRICTHGVSLLTGEMGAPIACVECVLDVLTEPLPEEVARARKRAEAKAEAVVAQQDKPQEKTPDPNNHTTYFSWPMVKDELCGCGGAVRRHPDGRSICAYGHVNQTKKRGEFQT